MLHAALLAVVLFALLPLVGTDGTFSSDEGAQILQAKAVSDGSSWSLPNSFPDVDPDGDYFALEKSHRTEDGFAPLPKLITYSFLLAQADRLAGLVGMVGLSIFGTVAAAAGAGIAAEMLRPGSGLLALWLTGGVSPLVADAYLVYAHTLAAACVAGAMVALLYRMRQPACRACVIAAPLLVYFAGLVRNEAVLVGFAMALGALVTGFVKRSPGLIAPGSAMLVAAPLSWVTDHVLQGEVLGIAGELSSRVGTSRLSGGADSDGGATFLGDRWRAFVTTWLRPAYEVHPSSVALLTVTVVGIVVVVAIRRRPVDRGLLLVSSCVVVLAAVASWLIPQPDPSVVPGLLIAFPSVVWGLVLLSDSDVRRPAFFFLLCSWSLSVAFVLLTQYPEGGAWEWGGRYFAAGLPLVTPLVAIGLRRASDLLPPPTRRQVVSVFLAVAILSAAGGINAVRQTHDRTAVLMASVFRTADTTDPGDERTPVIISTHPELPRSAWSSFHEYRWMLVTPDRLDEALRMLASQGVSELTLATRRSSDVTDEIAASGFELGEPPPREESSLWWITVLGR